MDTRELSPKISNHSYNSVAINALTNTKEIAWQQNGGGGGAMQAHNAASGTTSQAHTFQKVISNAHAISNDTACTNSNLTISSAQANAIPFDTIAVIIPCYNEEKTIAQVIDEVFSYLPQAFVYVFDNNSSDNSRAIVESKRAQYSISHDSISACKSHGLHAYTKENPTEENGSARNGEDKNSREKQSTQGIKYTESSHRDSNPNDKDSHALKCNNQVCNAPTHSNVSSISANIESNNTESTNKKAKLFLHEVRAQGKGAVMREAFALIDADVYVMIDADTQYDTSILPYALLYFQKHKLDMLNIAREADSGVHRKGHSFGNKLFSKTAQVLFGTNIKDMLSGYRIFSRPFVKSFPAHSNGFEIETELTIFALQQKLRVAEIEAPYKSRPEGSFSKLSTFKDGFKILSMILTLLCSERPLLVFGILSALCFLLSFVFGVPIFIEFLETSKVAKFPTLFVCVGFGVIAVVFAIAGFLAYLVSRSIKEQRRMAYLQSARP